MFLSRRAIAVVALLATPQVHGFSVQPRPFVVSTMRTSPSSTLLYGIRCENKYYQLEEMEDKENSTTELFLTDQGLVDLGETDGPLWKEAEGRWHVEPGTDNFSMVIYRRFQTGSSQTDMGEFAYEIGRTYTGVMTKVGDAVGITGVMHAHTDEFATPGQEVGYFNMIDGTDIREDRRPDARMGVQSR